MIERNNAGTPWILLAIYIALVGQAIATKNSQLDAMTGVLSLLPALIGTILTVLTYVEAFEE